VLLVPSALEPMLALTSPNEAMQSGAAICAQMRPRSSPRDRHWAMRIMRRLEEYRPPRTLQAEGFPDKIGALFRDEDEIPASADLSDQIKEALSHSDFLIVICTPDTPNSRWVRREIELFHELGKGDKILPVLVDGTASGSPSSSKRLVGMSAQSFSSRFGGLMPSLPSAISSSSWAMSLAG
jgi:MTH538 TIR-like domain (DUF1863)